MQRHKARSTRKGNTSDANKYTLTFAEGETPPVSFWSGRHAVSGSGDNTLPVCDLATGETKTTFRVHTGLVRAVAVTPDGRHAVSGSDDNTLRVWDLATGKTKTTLRVHTGP